MTRALLVVLVALAAALPPPASEAIRVVPLARDGQVLVSFNLENGLTEAIRAAIQSGLPATITYRVELRKSTPLWFDATLTAMTVTSTVRYDNLTRVHQLSRTIDGRGDASRRTKDEEDVRRWMTSVERLPLCPTNRLEANGEYYVRVQASTRPRVTWSFLPWDRGTVTGHAPYTNIIR